MHQMFFPFFFHTATVATVLSTNLRQPQLSEICTQCTFLLGP